MKERLVDLAGGGAGHRLPEDLRGLRVVGSLGTDDLGDGQLLGDDLQFVGNNPGITEVFEFVAPYGGSPADDGERGRSGAG